MSADTPSRLCRTADEAFQAGLDDCKARGLRMPPHLIDQMVALHRPYLLPRDGKQVTERDPAA